MSTNHQIIRHKNPNGKVTWHRAVYTDDKGQRRCSPRYKGKCSVSRKCAQNWLYANTHFWCKLMTVEQRTVDADGKSTVIQLGTELID